MRIYGSEIDHGSVNALLMIEPSEIGEYSRSDMTALNTAIAGAVSAYTRALGLPELILVRVIELDIQDDGAVMVNIEGAIRPEVQLGQYKGLCVAAEAEDLELEAVSAAKENMFVEVPEVMIRRKLETLLEVKKAETLSDAAANLLADIKEIYGELCRKAGLKLSGDALWEDALSLSRDCACASDAKPTAERLSALIKERFSSHASLPEDLEMQLEDAVRLRADQRRALLPEIVAEQAFEAKLKAENSSEHQWRLSMRGEAESLVRRELLLDAVADAEGIEVSDEQLEQELGGIERQFALEREEIFSQISRGAVIARLRRREAAALIAKSAVKI